MIYLDNFESKIDVAVAFDISDEDLKDINILVAHYDTPDYEGYAYVLFEKDNELYEVHGSHCSCFGLEGQWCPEKITVEELRHALNTRSYYSKQVRDVVDQVLVKFPTI